MKFFTSIRASLMLDKGQKLIASGDYRGALERALEARQLDLSPQFEWLSYMVEGKARFNLLQLDEAMTALRQAETMVQAELDAKPELTAEEYGRYRFLAPIAGIPRMKGSAFRGEFQGRATRLIHKQPCNTAGGVAAGGRS